MMAGLWQLELQTLLDILASAPSPVGSAVRWVESHGQSGVGCNRAGLGSLWRLVPDVLAKEVVFHEEAQEQPVAEGTVGKYVFLPQTLTLIGLGHQEAVQTDQEHGLVWTDLDNRKFNILRTSI